MASATLKRYTLFPEHDNTKYHSSHLPLPNVVRIEVLSPDARKRYLGQFHQFTEGLRQGIITNMSGDDCSAPFYGFFDPKTNGEIGFDVHANWSNSEHTGFDSFTSILQKAPVVGETLGGFVNAAKTIASKGLDVMGIDNESTGSNTMKTFRNADFNFTKTIKCSWYMPEMEYMARLSISRLIKMAFVKNFDTSKLTGNYMSQLATMIKQNYDSVKAIKQKNEAANAEAIRAEEAENKQATEETKPAEQNTAVEKGFLGKAWEWFTGLASDTADWWSKNGTAAAGDIFEMALPVAQKGFDWAVNFGIAANEFFGGSLTLNPLPVRLTMGHQLDIEPLVITGLKISGSQEQFMTTDGSNIPLFVNAEISVAMWMVPDPNKGPVQYLGDDLFNMTYTIARPAVDPALPAVKSSPSPRFDTPGEPEPPQTGGQDAYDAAKKARDAQKEKAAWAEKNPDAMVFPVYLPSYEQPPLVMRDYPAPETGEPKQDYSYTSPIY